MKKIISIAVAAGMLLSAAGANAAGIAVKENFEEGISNFGIAYSGRNASNLPAIFLSEDEFFSGNSSLEIVPTVKLPYYNGAGENVVYQGIYCGDYLQTQAGKIYSVSANVMTQSDAVKMRFIQTAENDIISVSEEYAFQPSVWLNAEYSFTAENTDANNKVVLAFYSSDTGGVTESVFVDDLVIRPAYVDAENWKSNTGTWTTSGSTATLTDSKDNFSPYNMVTCKIKKSDLASGTYYVSGILKSNMENTYVALSCDELPEVYETYTVKTGEETQISLPVDLSQLSADEFTLRLRISGDTESNGQVILKNFDLYNETSVLGIEAKDDKFLVSGKLKNGNEDLAIGLKINVGEGQVYNSSYTTDEKGEYTLQINVPDTVEYGTVLAIADGIKGYPTAVIKGNDYYVSSGYKGEITGNVKLCSDADDVEGVLTKNILSNLGLYSYPIFRNAELSDVAEFVFANGVSDITYEKLEEAIITGAALESCENATTDIYETIRRYNTYLVKESNSAYTDLFKKIDANTFDKLYADYVTAAPDKEAFNKKLSWTLVKNAVINSDNYSEAMSNVKKYATNLGLDLSKYTQIEDTGEGYTAATAFTSYLKTETDYSKIQEKLNTLCGGDGGGNGGGIVGNDSPDTGFTGNGVSRPSGPSGIVDTSPVENAYKFNDLSSALWAEDSIYRLLDNGIISRNDQNKFYPQNEITRAEFVKMVAVMLGYTDYSGEEVFSDVRSNDWYYKYVMALYERGIIMGKSEEYFGAEDKISRQDICVIFSRALGLTESAQGLFADHDDIAPYAVDAVYQMKNAAYINGYEDNTFRPSASTTRAEAAKILDNINGKK